jgi:hypothetical protein
MLRTARVVAVLAIGCAGAWAIVACAPSKSSKSQPTADASDYSSNDPGDPNLPPPRPPDYNNPDSGALGAGERARDASTPRPEGGTTRPPVGGEDASVPPTDDGGGTTDGGSCSGALAPGDLAIVEIMIASQAGSGDRGEWVEIQNTRQCPLNLNGLHIESPRGSEQPDSVDVDYDLVLGPNEMFIVADSVLGDLNHDLPGTVLSWVGTDALKNSGDTITLSVGTTTIDTLTYGDWGAHTGRSVSFPVDCAWSDRSDWARWSWSFNVWQPAQGDAGVPMMGTPNADNIDVACY